MASTGIAATNSGGVCFVYNNLQAAVEGTVSGNTNGVLVLPQVQGMEPQSALFMTARQPGGLAYRQPNNTAFPNSTNPCLMIGGDFGTSIGRLGYTKGGGFICNFGVNGTTNSTVPLTNTQTNTNSYWGDTTFATVNVIVLQNLNNIDGVSASSSSMYVNGSVTNGQALGLNTNGTYVVTGNGGTVVLANPNGFTVNAANANLLITPVNGGVFACAIYGA